MVKNKHTNEGEICVSCEDKLKEAHPYLSEWFRTKVKPKHQSAHISWTYRNEVSQNQAFAEGKSKLSYPHSKHNSNPARAIDLFELCSNGMAAWSWKYFKVINDEAKEANMNLVWGGDFKSIGDHDHWELSKDIT